MNNVKNNEIDFFYQTQKAIETLEYFNQQTFALNAHSIVAITDIKGTITFVNEKFEEISGYTKEELIGKNHRILNSGLHGVEFWENMYKTVSNGEVWNNEVRNINKKGEYYWVDTTIVGFYKDDELVSYIAIRTDITENKKDREELIKANEIAELSVIAKGEFLASMSHEIRTPMNGVIGMLGLLLKTDLDETQKHQATLAQSSATALLTIINDILDFSKVDAGKMELEHIDFDFLEELGHFSEAIAFKAEDKNVDLLLDTTYMPETLLHGDPGRIRQILSNIVGNSIKFTHEGYILIKVSLNTNDANDTRLIIEMSDTGIGIPQDRIDTLFDSFSQVDASTTRKYGGTGLGLAIVKKLCELMDGTVTVTSNEGYGTTFKVDIAIGISQNSKHVEPTAEIKNKKILILDRSEYSIDILQGQLEYWGMEVDGTCSPIEAMEMLEKNQYDIMFVDMDLKGIDAYKLCYDIRDNFKFNDMKLVMMTSLKERGNALKHKELGINASFPKPATTKDLLKALNVLNENYDKEIEKENSFNEDSQEAVDWGDNCNILLVEDNKTNQLVVMGMLEDIGLDADIANNGVEALEILNKPESNYNILLMDCQMPELDGYETTRAIRNNEAGTRYNQIQIIAMTANAMQGDREKCEMAGMNDYIAKPIDPEILKSILKDKLKQWLIDGKKSNFNS